MQSVNDLKGFDVDVEQLVRTELARGRGGRILDHLAAATIFAGIFITGACGGLLIDAYHTAWFINAAGAIN